MRSVGVLVGVREPLDLPSAFKRELDREWFRERKREGLSFEGDDEEGDGESLPREIMPRPGMVVELDRGVAPTNGLTGTFSDSILVRDGMTVSWGGNPGPSDARRVEEDFVGVVLFGVLVRLE